MTEQQHQARTQAQPTTPAAETAETAQTVETEHTPPASAKTAGARRRKAPATPETPPAPNAASQPASPASGRAFGRASGPRPPAYDFRAFEERWRAAWEASGIYRTDLPEARRPYYTLMMFPYPSAEGLHVGNMYAYVGADIHGRYQAMRGYDVFEPMGFDAFGIHSENFALKRGAHPAALTAHNVAHFRTQLSRIGNRFDWSHEVNTTDPDYYRWTQWIFVQMFKGGFAERKRGTVNWCPNDKTVLADEQVIAGRCERCGALVERRALEQWYLKTTKLADRLLANLETLDWDERVKAAQRNWIGRSEGLEFALPIATDTGTAPQVTVFTTRPDTIYGVTFVAIAPEHPLVASIVSPERRVEVAAYQAKAARNTQRGHAERAGEEAHHATGVFTGAYAIHPLTGERVPVWVADYVLMDYGTGAVMGVPAHDSRDFAFARVMGIPVRQVVFPRGADAAMRGAMREAYTEPGIVQHSGPYNGMPSAEATARIIADFAARGTGERVVQYQLRDWAISRQRYWGPPIPIIWCPEHGAVPVPEEQLPVVLPPLEDYAPRGDGTSPLSRVPEFVNTTCPVCGKAARRETDVSDNFLDSAWYFLRYPSSDDASAAWDAEMTRKWLPVDMYIGGAEHSVLHLMYARFLTMALHQLGLLPFEEPFTRFRAHGIITRDGAKIAKSRGNVINPDRYIERYGADVFRCYLMFMGPYQRGGDFTEAGLGGVVRFLERVWRLVTAAHFAEGEPSGEAAAHMHRTIARVSEDTAALKYNTAVAALMEEVNALEGPTITQTEARTLVTLLAPYAPYLAEELWSRLGGAGSVHQQPWPESDTAALRTAVVSIPVQVHGKLRAVIEVPAEADEAAVRAAALAEEAVQRALAGRAVARVVYVPGRLMNLVGEG